MAAQKIQVQNLNNSESQTHTVDVLYQKMGGRWYAFSLVGDDVFMGSISEEEVVAAENTGVEKFLDLSDTHSHDAIEAL